MPGLNGTTLPSETAAPASVTTLRSGPRPPVFRTHTEALSAHVIDPELLLPPPRRIRVDRSTRIQVGLFGWNLLRHGRAVPAIIVEMEHQSDGQYRIVFNYARQD